MNYCEHFKCKYVGSIPLMELTERFNNYITEQIRDLTVLTVGETSDNNDKVIYNISFIAIAQTTENEENPTMDCFQPKLVGDAAVVCHQINMLISKVINARKNGQNVADIDFV